jgi:hypothetical protein
MANPIEVRAEVESQHNATRDSLEKAYVANRDQLEQEYHEALEGARKDKEAALVAAGLNPDGSAPPSFDRVTPANISLPVVTGTPTTGQTLTCTVGSWANADSTTFQWLRNGAAIVGATDDQYVLVVADEGTTVRCRVTATNESGSVSVESNAVNPTA